MVELRPFDALGGADHGWLKAKHHFSFARYHDPDRLGHGASACGTTTRSRRTPASRPTPTPTWRSSPMSARARSPTRTASAITAAPKPATCRL